MPFLFGGWRAAADVQCRFMKIRHDHPRAASEPTGSHWRRRPSAAARAAQKDWLTRTGSLTRHLSTLGRVEVRVIREHAAQPWPDEAACLGISARTPVWLREVVLYVDGVAMVAAHSIAPLSVSRGVWRAMRALGTRPLAELLYTDAEVARSALTSRRLTARAPLYRYARGFDASGARSLLARRSVFMRRDAPLMVTECMLPALWRALEQDGGLR
jgi:chorismate lyase